MKRKHLPLVGLLAGGIFACHKEADVVKTAAQAAADQKAIAVRAAADQKIAAQNEADSLKAAALKEAAVKKAKETAAPAPTAPK